jgi:DnaJ like chaperone protein
MDGDGIDDMFDGSHGRLSWPGRVVVRLLAIWGKLVGGVTGLVIGGPIGAALGAVAGHAFDSWQAERRAARLEQAEDAEPLFGDPMETRRVAFATAVIALGAKLAKVDGVVTRDEIRAFKRVFEISDDDVGSVARVYDEAKRSPHGFEPYARQIAILFAHDPAVLEQLLTGLFEIASVDGHPNAAELDYLARVAAILGFSPRQFATIRARYVARHRPARIGTDPYAILGVSRRARDEDIRKVYRHLVREHHPDRLTAKGVPEEFVARANEKLATINAAFDQIAKERGLR